MGSSRKADPLRLDPTRTTDIRQRFAAELTRRFTRLKRAVVELIRKEDALGIVVNTRWKFNTNPDKIKQFQRWLQLQIRQGILKPPAPGEDVWTAAWIQEAYKRAHRKAFDSVRLPSLKKSMEWYQGGREEFLRSSFSEPASIEKVKLLASRTYDDLEGVTNDMSTQMSRALADGMLKGQNPNAIARTLADRADVSLTRARVIARTETIRAHAEGTLDAFEKLGVESVGVAVEWSTTNDGKVCPKCAALAGVVLTISEARGKFPLHPNCRCSPIPANVGESQDDQQRDPEEIREAMEEAGIDDGEIEIDEERPEGIIDEDE